MKKFLLATGLVLLFGTSLSAQRVKFDYLRAAYFGWSTLTNVNYYGNWAEGTSSCPGFLEQDMGKSFGFAIDVCSFRFILDRQERFDVELAMRFSFEDHVFKNPGTTLVMAGGKPWPVPTAVGVGKSKTHMGYVGLPLDISYRTGKFKIYVGATAEILMDSYVKYKYPETRYSIQGVNNFRSVVEIGMSYRHLGIYANWAVTPLFKQGTGSDARTLSVGLILCK